MSEMTLTKSHDVVVVGGGQAGLAIGYHLANEDRDFTILEAASAPAAAWRERWDSLKLFTSARYDALPGMGFREIRIVIRRGTRWRTTSAIMRVISIFPSS